MPNFVPVIEAHEILEQANKVLVIGCSGGGKTTLALRISEKYALAYQSIDRDVRWLPGRQVRDRTEQRQIISELAGRDRWVMDGTSPSSFDIRVPRADLIVWVRLPRRIAIAGVVKRVLVNYGKVRVAMAEGCPEPIPDRDFLSYIWSFERKSAPKLITQIDKHGPTVPVAVLKSRADIANLIVGE